MDLYYKRLPLDMFNNFKPRNVRDIGGYPAGNGITKWKTFLRCEGLECVTEHDAAFLYEYGIRTVIDLRFCTEFEKNNTEYLFNVFSANKITLINMPFVDNYDDITGHYYMHMVDKGKKNIKQIFEYIAGRLADGGIMYNCFAGKDRTGVLSALLLLLCGVSEIDVLADYMVSSVYLKSLVEKLGLINDAQSSNPKFMEEFLIYFKQKYQSAEQYLLSIGISHETIATIKDQFTQQF
ncbi:MAG: tyrosine-protein phosphatase [Oscillospiraceae bacterium]|nr:tyrosine-protein phosphatase [Oscillospiraceae bacterium]